MGFNSISNYKLESSVGNDLLDEYETGDLAIVATLVGSSYALRYKPIGLLGLEADSSTGLTLTKDQASGSNKMKLDLKDRGNEAFGVHDYRFGSSSSSVKIFSSSDIDAIDVAAGSGISVTKNGNVATIAADPTSLTDVVSGSKELTCEKNGRVVTITFSGEEHTDDTVGYTGD